MASSALREMRRRGVRVAVERGGLAERRRQRRDGLGLGRLGGDPCERVGARPDARPRRPRSASTVAAQRRAGTT